MDNAHIARDILLRQLTQLMSLVLMHGAVKNQTCHDIDLIKHHINSKVAGEAVNTEV
jgi:hypothetical protein